ncbi:unnamed protein product [Adineta ricciae]|uniref:Nephrocystin-3 n=1 Tax=Adineta ricciae TaxID=249248 RepID=A0A814Z610_ADIRI|nr:unnamed protein product [Adineta ricciae]CAF1488731.1 unnamed protein product [Adineta ricciae]
MGAKPLKLYKPADENLESLSLVWLDAHVDTSRENIQIQNQLRSIINYMKTFQDVLECEKYIRSVPDDDRILLIVSGGMGQQLVPSIHKLRQILSIYVFCLDKSKHEGWSQQYTKIKGLFTKREDLVREIESDRQRRKKGDEPILISIQGKSTSELNGQFVHSQILIDVLLRIKPTREDKDELISRCYKTYKENDIQLAAVKEFDGKYKSNQALWWYSRECFVYRILNRAFRTQDIDILYLFRFFILDLHKQLNEHRCKTSIQVYRAQQMSKDEFEMLRNSIGQFISINSFLSTSFDRLVALRFLNATLDADLENVLFEITADPNVASKPFADITQMSCHRNEKEVLFMVGSIFQLVGIRNDDGQTWIIQMSLCSDDDHHLQVIFEHMRSEHGGGEKNLLSFANVLAEMGRFDEAEKYYHRLLDHLPLDDPDIGRCYHGLGNITDAKGDYDTSLQWHQKSLHMRMKLLRTDHPHLAPNYISIGCAYFNKEDYHRALESYFKAYEIIQNAFGEDHPDVAMCLNNIGCVYEREKEYETALEYHDRALKIREDFLPEYHFDIGQSHHNLGNVYRALGCYDLALENYLRALTIKNKSLPYEHHDVALTLENIGNVYKDKEEYDQALEYYKKAETIYDCCFLPTHANVIQIKQYIQYLS